MDLLSAIEEYWSDRASTFDEEPDHGLTDPHVRVAWANRLAAWIPLGAGRVADLGCGTGSLSVLLAEAGAEVVGVDLSPAMVERARAKARLAGRAIEFRVGDASDPDLPGGSFDAVVARHLLWTLPSPVAALARWTRMLKPAGRAVLIEGRWFDATSLAAGDPLLPWSGGVAASDLIGALEPLFTEIEHVPLSEDAALWGRVVPDERYAVVARNPVPA